MTDQVVIDLDDEIIFHLALPESVAEFRTEQVNTELIFDQFARDVFTWQMNHFREHGQAATAAVLEDEFDGFDDTPVLELLDPETAVGDLIKRLRERYIRYEGKKAVGMIADSIVKEPLDVAHKLLVEGRRLAELTVSKGEVFGSGDFDRAWDAYVEQANRGAGPSVGYDEIDGHFHGLRGLTYCVATRKSFKSWITINSLVQNVRLGIPCYLYCLELPALESYWRCACLAANLPFWKYIKGKLMPADKKKVQDAAEELDASGLFYHEKPPAGSRGVQYMVERALDKGAECIYFDQLQYIETQKGRSIGSLNDTAMYWEVCNDLRDYSDQVPLWIVHQFNRSVMHNVDEFPDSQQGKGSSAVEETATLELGLWASKEMRKNRVLQFGTLESRNHDKLHWHIEVELNIGCAFNMIGEIEEDEEDGDGD
jgi:hypothetical protein